jgi:hypothetical protein
MFAGIICIIVVPCDLALIYYLALWLWNKYTLLYFTSKLPKQSVFQILKGFVRVVADIQRVENVPMDLLGQAG